MINHLEEDTPKSKRTSKESSRTSSKRVKSANIKEALEMVRNMDDAEENNFVDDDAEENYLDDDFDDFYHYDDVDQDVTLIDNDNDTNNDDDVEEVLIVQNNPEKNRRELLCFDELMQLRENICMQEKIPSKFLSNAIIGQLSRKPPSDLASLRGIIGDGSIIEKHLPSMLAILRKYKCC